MRVLRVSCTECGQKAVIKKTVWKDKTFADLYMSCSDGECGHTFVMNLGFSHTLNPSLKSNDSWMRNVLNGLTPEQRKDLLCQLQTQSS